MSHRDQTPSFQRLVSALPSSMLVLLPDAPRYTIVSASEILLKIVGARLSDIVGRGMFEAFPEDPTHPASDGPGALRISLGNVCATGRVDYMPMVRYDVAQPGGAFEERWWMPVNAPLFGADGKLEYILHRSDEATAFVHASRPDSDDAMARRLHAVELDLLRHSQQLQESHAQLAETERRQRALLANIPSMLFRADRLPPWHMHWVSEGFERLTGFPAEHVVRGPATWQSLIIDQKHVLGVVAAQNAADIEIVVEYRIRHADGLPRWVEGRATAIPGNPGLIEGTIINIDVRKRAELALIETRALLRESEELARATIDSVPALVWRARPDGEVDFASDYSRKMFGVEPAQMLADGWMATIHPDDREALAAAWAHAASSGEPFAHSARALDTRGGYRWFLARAQARKDADGRVLQWFGTTADIDPIKQAQARAEMATRAKSAFLSTMSHEIRTPLNAVLGFAALLADTALGAQQRDFIDSIHASGEHLLGVINDILDHSRLESERLNLAFAPCEVRSLVASALGMVASQAAPRSLKLLSRIDEDVPEYLIADCARLRQVLVNLLGNAVKFTDAGEVVVSVSARALSADEHEFEFRVNDTGIGIAADRMDRLFRDFSQIDDSVTRRFGGSGLGLAISKRLVEAHGGTMSVESQPGVGSSFSFRIPARRCEAATLVPAAPLSSRESAVLAEAVTLPPLKLLLVEDNLANRKVALLLLRKLGFEGIDIAVDGLEAIEALVRSDYDVVLMDVQMPRLDGLDATRRIRSEIAPARQPQIVAMTADAMIEDREACLATGMDDYVAKPFSLAQLADALLRAAQRRGVQVSRPASQQAGERETAAARAFQIASQVLAGGGEMGALMRRIDWSQTPLGPVYTWPQSLRTALSIVLNQKHPMFLWWGNELIQFYNDAFRPILGSTMHPAAMGQRGRECWSAIWDTIGPMLQGVIERGESSMVERGLLCLHRNGFLEEGYFSYGYSAIRDESGGVGGVLVACSENTVEVIGARRAALLLELDECLIGIGAQALDSERLCAILARAQNDLPFALIYRVDTDGAQRVCVTGLATNDAAAPTTLHADDLLWPVFECLRTQHGVLCENLANLPALPPWPEPIARALILPVSANSVFIAGISPRLALDADYRSFLHKLAARLGRCAGL
ncbi:MAG: ATP-binding protein [Panacagrimonas sp.]